MISKTELSKLSLKQLKGMYTELNKAHDGLWKMKSKASTMYDRQGGTINRSSSNAIDKLIGQVVRQSDALVYAIQIKEGKKPTKNRRRR